jgi:hypothetical protein
MPPVSSAIESPVMFERGAAVYALERGFQGGFSGRGRIRWTSEEAANRAV